MSERVAAQLSHISPAHAADRELIVTIADHTGAFSAEELVTVREMFESYLKDPVSPAGYRFSAYRDPDTGQMLGYVCWGFTSLSEGSVDLFWLATDPAAQGRGIATLLFRSVEAEARAAGRWLLMLYTSSSPAYAAARRMYIREGYYLAMQLSGFYHRGDDLCVYVKELDAQRVPPVELGPGEK
jgi:GNAT superfamily N-acetyltransferase